MIKNTFYDIIYVQQNIIIHLINVRTENTQTLAGFSCQKYVMTLQF